MISYAKKVVLGPLKWQIFATRSGPGSDTGLLVGSRGRVGGVGGGLVLVGVLYMAQPLEQTLEAFRTTEKNFDYESFIKQFGDVRYHLQHDETHSVVVQGLTEKPVGDMR